MTISRAQMNRQLYDLGGAVDQARDFYTNNLGMNPQEANAVLSDAMASLNQQMQPQSMMQMASNGGRIGFNEGGLTEYELLKLKELGYNVRKEGTETFGGVSVLKDILKTNKMAGGGIARLGYQMGGISAMPMDFGQPLQVPQQTSMPMQPMMSSPMANYGQTPLTMAGGGIARLGYQTGGVTLPSQGSELSQMGGMNQEQALQTIIQILIENGIPPEQAQQLALQLLQIFLEGGEPAIESFGNQLEQEEQTQMMAGGGIAGLYPREGYFLGKIVKGVGKAIKGVGKAVKSVVKSDIGKLALAAAAIYAGGGGFGISPGGFSFMGSAGSPGLFGSGTFNLGQSVIGQGLGSIVPTGAKDFLLGEVTEGGTRGIGFLDKLNPFSSNSGGVGGFIKGIGTGIVGSELIKSLIGPKQDDETDEEYQQRAKNVGPYLGQYYTNLNPGATPEQVNEFVRRNTVEYAAGGGIMGSMIPPARRIEGGIIELDARKSGGYIPYGKKERVDDVPAMLAKDEFVFTSRAVKAAGDGSARRGAAKMYKLMKQLEAKGMKMERGARA